MTMYSNSYMSSRLQCTVRVIQIQTVILPAELNTDMMLCMRKTLVTYLVNRDLTVGRRNVYPGF